MKLQQPNHETTIEIQSDHQESNPLNPESPPRPLPKSCRNNDSPPPRVSTNEPMKKIGTPDRLRVPIAFKHPERYRSPTDAMMSPVTKGLLARSRKASGSLIPPSFNQTKVKFAIPNRYQIQELRKPESGLSSIMETKTVNDEHQWRNSISSSSSSRSSSITSDSSDGHFDIRHFPLPKPSLSASEAQKLREAHQAYNSSVSSYTGSSWSSIHQNHLVDIPGYNPNRIPSSVFSSKPANSTEWSIASNESLFSIHDVNFNISTREDHGLAAASTLAETPRFEETVPEIIEINPVPPVKKRNESETIAEEETYQVELSDSEIDDSEKEEKISGFESDDEEEEEEEEIIEAEVFEETETKNPEEKEVEQVVKENKQEDSNSIVSHSPSISYRSDTSNNSIGSFAFPPLQKEDAFIKTPSMEIRGNVSHKQRPEYQLPQSPVIPPQPQPQPYSESSTLTDMQPQSQPQPQRKASKKFESRTQSLKASSTGWFSCFHCPSKCSLFK